MSQPNFVTFTSTRIVHKEPMGGNFTGNQNDGMFYVRFADGSGGIEKHMKDWHGNKTGRLYRAEILAAQEYLASRVGEVMDAPIRDCRFTSTDAKKIVMPALNGQSGEECQNDVCYPPNISGGKLRLFDYLTANADRRPKNIMHTSEGTVGIDHALCNFRPREATPEVVADVWNRGITTDYLEALQPKLEALQPTFHQFAMDDKYQNMMDNLDKLIKAFQILSQYVAITKGDVAGHDFHGNQYTGGIGGDVDWKPTMTPAEAKEWAKNSAIQVPLYHGTNSPESIMAEGFRDNTGGGNLINGTYVTDFNPREVEGETKWGLHTVKVMANVHSIATPEQSKEIKDKVQELYYTPHDYKINPGDEARKIAIEQGFDAIQPSKGVYIILDPKNLVVVSDEIQKGDVVGHDFHGNQYTTVGGVSRRVYWHGSPNGKVGVKVASYGVHVGGYLAAKEALEARIGKRADGKDWDGTQEYGKTPIMGGDGKPKLPQTAYYEHPVKNEDGSWGTDGVKYTWEQVQQMRSQDPKWVANSRGATYSDGSPIPMDAKPDLFPVAITGTMKNTPNDPISDDRANSTMTRTISAGNAKNGYYYSNEGEGVTVDANGNIVDDISAVVPSADHLTLIPKEQVIAKGDVLGHEFHGNQYTDTEGHTQVHPDFKFGKEGSLEGAKIDPAKVGEICMSPEYTAFLNKTLGTSHTAVNPWTKEVTEVHPNNAIYGGCLATAEALKLLFPNGEIKAAITTSEAHITDAVAQGYHPMVDHFVLSVGDGKFMDGRGLITEQQATDLNGMGPMRNGLYLNHLVEATPAMIDEKRPMILSPTGAPEALANFITQRAGVSKSVSKAAGELWAKYALFTIRKGDVKGHNFHGNQYEQVEGEIKPENLKLPSGWRLASQDEKTYTITSDKGNSALFNKGAVPYKIGTMGFAGNEKDLMEDGKKDVWTPENPIAVAALKSVDAQATGKTIDFATSAGEKISSYAAATNPNDTSVIKIGKLSTINDSIAGTLPSDTMGIVAGKDDWGASAVFSDPAKMMEVTITHELGHIDFTDRGLSVDDIKEALSKTKDDLGIEKMPNWGRLEANFLKRVSSNYEKQGKEVPTDLLATKLGRGSAPQSDTGRRWLQSVGATKYGSSRLQECYAECYAIWHTPNFAITPLVANMASVAGWGERPKGNA